MGFDYKSILTWLLNAVAVAKENVIPLLEAIEKMLNTLESIGSMFGATAGALQSYEPTPDELALEGQIAEAIGVGPNSGFDFSKFRAILQKAKELGILDSVMAFLVSKVKIPGLPAGNGSESEVKV